MDTTALTRFWYHGTEDEWLSMLDQYDSLVTDVELEERLARLDWREVKGMSAEKFYDFLYDQYYVWKYDAPNRLSTVRGYLKKQQENGSLDELERIKNELFAADRDDCLTMLKIAEQIRGMGTAGASGLLAFLFPDQFGVLDQYIVIALRKVERLPQHDALQKMPAMGMRTNDGVLLEEILRSKAAELNRKYSTGFWTPRKLDMVLWTCEQRD